jgi:hypothetical protein
MKEPYFRDTTCSSTSSPMSEQPQDWRNTPSQRAASTRKNLLLETMTTVVVTASGEARTTKVQFSANYPLVQFSRFAIATVAVCRSRFRLAHRHERTTRQ